jgi:putative transposase
MRKSAFTEEQIAYALREAEAGTPVLEICRKPGVSEQTFYRWKRKCAGMGIAELRRLRQLEEENRRLKQRTGGSDAGSAYAAGGDSKTALTPAQHKPLVDARARRLCGQ